MANRRWARLHGDSNLTLLKAHWVKATFTSWIPWYAFGLLVASSSCGALNPALQQASVKAKSSQQPQPEEAEATADHTAPFHSEASPDGSEEEEAEVDDSGAIDDGLELPPPDLGSPVGPPRSPLTAMTDQEIEDKLLHDPVSLGSMSIGSTNAGVVFNGVAMPEGDQWVLVDKNHAYGTQETIDSLIRAIQQVHKQFPGSPKMYIGHVSAQHGGHLSPHISHQAGRDVDISYYLDSKHRWYQRATRANLDCDRSWAFVRALITETDVELILIDSSVQKLLKEHALKIGEDPEWLQTIFQVGSKHARPLIRHAKGHANHIHVRFYNPIAQESATRAYSLLIKHGVIKPPVNFVRHTAKKGQTLGSLANRYGTTVQAIQKANGLKSTLIHAKRTYLIPKKGGAAAPPARVIIPPRRLPPSKTTPSSTLPQGASGPEL